uniref:Uncharacterized protein n=1 Tax=OCS116 cluster bacterium TaxID=2030921 RepID=A0A2A4YSR7_9PROT
MSEEHNSKEKVGHLTANTSSSNVDQTIHDPKRRHNILFAVCIALMAVIASVTGLTAMDMNLMTRN